LSRILSLIIFWCSSIVSAGILIVYFKKRNFLKKAILIGIAFFILLFLGIGIFQSVSTYYIWKADPISKYLIPPVNPNYFYQYCLFHYFLNFFISLGAAIFLGLIFFIFKKKNYVDFNEVLLVVLGTIIVGSPNFIIFLGLAFLIAIFLDLWQNYKKRVKIKRKVSLILPMLISLILTILAGNIIAKYIGLAVLRI